MDKRLFKVTMKSVRRRWREVLRTFVAAFMAVFFVTGILLFEENMFEWQVASNKDRFGDWFLLESNVSAQSEVLKSHPKLSGYAEAYSAMTLYDENYSRNDSNIGYMSPEFIKMGCINLVEGRMPEADNEVAMDRNTLAKHGISLPEIGQTITIRYYEDDEAYEGAELKEDMVLVGILEDYSNVWYQSRYLPGALVTKEKYEAFDNEKMPVYIYQLVESERHGDHRAIYEEILSEIKTKPAYNFYVYDYKPWSSDNVYNYMYVLVMVIGIAALTYQLIVYKNSRKNSNDLMRKLGATKRQITAITFVENVLMLLPAGVLGMGMAALAGKVVCLIIEAQMGISFYYISLEILLKGLIAIVVAVAVCEIVSVILSVKHILVTKEISADNKKPAKKVSEKSGKSTLKNSHVFSTISFRFTKANKWTQNLGVRIFSLGVCVVLVMCSLRIYNTYVAYEANKDNIDIKGVTFVDEEFELQVPFYVVVDKNAAEGLTLFKMRTEGPGEYEVSVTKEQIENYIDNGVDQTYDEETGEYHFYTSPVIDIGDGKFLASVDASFYRGLFYKEPKTNFTKGFTEHDIEILENVVGVDSITYSAYESQRTWRWDGMTVGSMGYGRLMQERNGSIASAKPYGTRNIFATEYISPTEELYDRLCKYIDPDMQDYDAFAEGEQVLVLLEDNPYGVYDESLTAGETISYGYYEMSVGSFRYDSEYEGQEIFGCEEDYSMHMFDVDGIYDEHTDRKGEKYWIMTDDARERFNMMGREFSLGTCVETKAVAVVRMTDDIREEFADILPSDSYYTAIASTKLAEKACANQNKIMAEVTGEKELPEDCQVKMEYNQLAIKYNMLASFSATDNIISRYCDENCIEYVSYADLNEKCRTDFINAILQYGITMIAVIVINMLICAVIARNRLAARKQRTELLLRLGTQRKDVRKVFMIEAVREALWCVFTLPVVLLIQYVIYRKNV